MTARCLAAALACLFLWASPALAQGTKQAKEFGSDAQPAFVVVEGLAPADLLNVRATASPTGLLLSRVQNGTMLRSFGCTPVNGYDWCRVEGVNDPDVKGWTPARYLLLSDAAPTSQQAAAPGSSAETVPDEAPLATFDAAPRRQAGPTNMDTALAEAAKAGSEAGAALAASRPPEMPQFRTPPSEATAPMAATDTRPEQTARPLATSAAPAPVSATEDASQTAEAQEPAAPVARQASVAPPASDGQIWNAPTPSASVTVFSPAVLVLCGFPMVLMAAMAAIASFGSFAFTSPFQTSEASA